jgi:hypothetical protein
MNFSQAFFLLTIISFGIIYGVRRIAGFFRTKAFNKN